MVKKRFHGHQQTAKTSRHLSEQASPEKKTSENYWTRMKRNENESPQNWRVDLERSIFVVYSWCW